MTTRNRRRQGLAATAGLAVLVMTTGCTQVLNAALDNRGVSPARGMHSSATRIPARPDRQHTSSYEHTPRLSLWSGASFGPPSSVASRLSNSLRGMSVGGPVNCQVVPAGLSRVLPIEAAVTGTPLFRYRDFTVGLAGNLAPTRGLIDTRDGLRFAQQALAASARMGTEGGQCGRSLFLFVRIDLGATQPVSVLH